MSTTTAQTEAAKDEAEHEMYAQAELDQDRNPTAEGFAAWKARRTEAAGVER